MELEFGDLFGRNSQNVKNVTKTKIKERLPILF